MNFTLIDCWQVVLANGSIVNANNVTNTDLYFALRGGGNNFGIVTRFDLETFGHGQIWGGMAVYPLSTNATQFDAYYWFNKNAAKDPKAALILAVVYVQGQYFFSNDYEYTDPVVTPAVFGNFTSIPNISDSTRITNLLNLTTEIKDTEAKGIR